MVTCMRLESIELNKILIDTLENIWQIWLKSSHNYSRNESLTWENTQKCDITRQWESFPCWSSCHFLLLIFPPSLLIKTRISWFLLWQSPRHKGCAASPAGRQWFSGSTSSQPGWSPHSSGEPLPSPPPVSGRLPGHSAATPSALWAVTCLRPTAW